MIRPRRLVNRLQGRTDAITPPLSTIALTLTSAAFAGHLVGTLWRLFGG